MTDALLLSLVEKLDNWLLVEESDSIIPSKKKLYASVTSDLRAISYFLRDEKLVKDTRSKYLISDIIEIALDLDKDIDSNYDIESVERWVKEVMMRMFKLTSDGAAEAETRTGRESSSILSEINVGGGDYYCDEIVVGLEKDVELMLLTATFYSEQPGYNELQTFLITGMVGIGKTTLARQLYNHANVVEHFELRAWVCVSSDLTIKEVLMKLIQQVVDCDEVGQRDSLMEKLECADNQSLQQMLHQHLQGMRYFIVLDDWPKAMHLASILKALPDEDKGSKLLLTCPSYISDINAYQMKTLDSDKSWQLFLKTISCGNKFTSEQMFPKHLEIKGREMLKSCGGLPLAVKDMGRQIAETRRLGIEWEHVLESIDMNAIFKLLELFYYKLDGEVKLSFLLLAFFKENATMRNDKLRQICSAGGINSIFCTNQLVDDSILVVHGVNDFHDVKSFKINAMLHMLSIRRANIIGFEILRNNGNSGPSQSPRHPCHRVVICSRDKYNHSTDQDKHLVSLIFHGGGYFDDSPSYWKSFELLRVLDLEDFGLKILPESIGTLVELRYLGLRNNYIQELPHSLGCLKLLEVLDIALNFLVDVSDVIWEMASLRHLYMSDVICRKPLKIDALQNLETLTYISVDNLTYELSGLECLTRLHKLGIEDLDGNSEVSELFASLAELGSLTNLILRGFCFRSMPCLDKLRILHRLQKLKLDGLLAKLPSAEDFPPCISELKLVNSSLDEDPMPLLERLPLLKKLKLRNAYTGQEMVISHDGFPMLELLIIQELQNLRSVQVGEDGMPRLLKLEMTNCPNMESLPEVIGSKTYLDELKMVTTKSIAKKINSYVEQSGLISKICILDVTYVT